MTDKEKIRAEIERRIEETKSMKPAFDQFWAGQISAFKGCLNFIDSMPEELTPKGYDEAYLNECIAKASKTWKGVDVDKFMDEVRGRESDDLEGEIQKYMSERWEFGCINPTTPVYLYDFTTDDLKEVARHFAEWQRKQDQETIELAEDHAMLAGMNKEREELMKGAVEGEVVKDISNKLAVTAKINLAGFKFGQKVKIIIIQDDESRDS